MILQIKSLVFNIGEAQHNRGEKNKTKQNTLIQRDSQLGVASKIIWLEVSYL